MILIVVSHCDIAQSFKEFIFFFHVPVFFVISGYFFRKRDFISELNVDCRRLLIPLIFSSALLTVYFALAERNVFLLIKSLCWGAGFPYYGLFVKTESIGPFWFLWAMFWTRLFFCFLNKVRSEYLKGLCILLLAILFINIKHYFFSLPFSIIPAICAMGYFFLGYLMNLHRILYNEKKQKFFLFTGLCWFLCQISVGHNLDVNQSFYKGFYFLDVLGCAFVFLLLYGLCKNMTDNLFSKTIRWIGRYSLCILCVHAFEYNVLQNYWPYLQRVVLVDLGTMSIYVVVVLRVLIAILGAKLLLRSRFVKEKIFFIVENVNS